MEPNRKNPSNIGQKKESIGYVEHDEIEIYMYNYYDIIKYLRLIILDIIHDGGIFYETARDEHAEQLRNKIGKFDLDSVDIIINIFLRGLVEYNKKIYGDDYIMLPPQLEEDLKKSMREENYDISKSKNFYEMERDILYAETNEYIDLHTLWSSNEIKNIVYSNLWLVDGLPATYSKPEDDSRTLVKNADLPYPENEIRELIYDKSIYSPSSVYDNGSRTHIVMGNWDEKLLNNVFTENENKKAIHINKLFANSIQSAINYNYNYVMNLSFGNDEFTNITLFDTVAVCIQNNREQIYSTGLVTGKLPGNKKDISYRGKCMNNKKSIEKFTEVLLKVRAKEYLNNEYVLKTYIRWISKFLGDHSQILFARAQNNQINNIFQNVYANKLYIGIATYDELLALFAQYMGVKCIYYDKVDKEFSYIHDLNYNNLDFDFDKKMFFEKTKIIKSDILN